MSDFSIDKITSRVEAELRRLVLEEDNAWYYRRELDGEGTIELIKIEGGEIIIYVNKSHGLWNKKIWDLNYYQVRQIMRYAENRIPNLKTINYSIKYYGNKCFWLINGSPDCCFHYQLAENRCELFRSQLDGGRCGMCLEIERLIDMSRQ